MTGADIVPLLKKHPLTVACGVLSLGCAVALYLRADKIDEYQQLSDQKAAEASNALANVRNSEKLAEQTAEMQAATKELEGRVVITDKDGRIVATLGDNPDKKQWAAYKLAPELWREGIFAAPHGVAFDADGNLFVQDWNYIGRLTKLRRAPLSLAAMP